MKKKRCSTSVKEEEDYLAIENQKKGMGAAIT